MELFDSKHWKIQKQFRPNITDSMILFAIINSNQIRDEYWEDALNAIARIPPSGRLLKVVYKKISKEKLKIITAIWLD